MMNDTLTNRPGPEEAEYPYLGVLVGIGAIVALYLSSFAGYILFHALVEVSTIAIALTFFILTWHTRRFLPNGSLLVLGVGYGLIAGIDLLHTLAYKGMGIFPTFDANLPTQLWIAARFLQAVLLCVAPVFARRRINGYVLFGICLVAVSATTALVFSGAFPDCFIEGQGLTPFKIVSEYVICALLGVALFLFIGKRTAFSPGIFTLIVISILCTIGSELAFTRYLSVYGPANMAGHFLKLAAFYLIYRALLVTGLQAPFDLIFRDMKQAQERLTEQREFNRCLLDSMADGVVACDADGSLTLFNRAARQWHGLDPMRLPPEDWARHYDLFRADGVTPLPTAEIPLTMAFRDEAVTDAGMAIVAAEQAPRFILANGSEIKDTAGHKLGAVVVMHDITAFRRLEQELRESNQDLERRVAERTAALGASEEKYRDLIQKIQAAVVVHGADSRILISNAQAQRLLGFSAEQMTGKAALDPDWHFLCEDGSALPPEAYPVSRVLTTEKPLRDVVLGVRRPGTDDDAWVLVSADPVRGQQGDVVQVIVTFVDITGRKKAEEALQRLNRELCAISSCNQTLMKAEDEQTLLHDICRIICDEAGYRLAWVGYAEHDREKTIRPVAWAGLGSDYVAEARLSWSEKLEHGRGPAGLAIRGGEPVQVQDFITDPRMLPWRESALAHGYRSGIALPLKEEKGTVFGVLLIYSAEPYALTAEEFKLLEELAGDLAFGITVLRIRTERRRTEESLRQSEARLTEAQRLAHFGNWELDLTSNALLWSDEIYRIFEIDREQFGASYDAFLEAIHPADREMVNRAYTQSVADHTPYGIVHRLLIKDGRIKYVEERGENFYAEDGRHLRSAGTVHDITERKLAEEAVLTLNQQLERRVAERTAELEAKNDELERINQLFVGRELRMVELKEKISELEEKTNKEARPVKEK